MHHKNSSFYDGYFEAEAINENSLFLNSHTANQNASKQKVFAKLVDWIDMNINLTALNTLLI